MRTTTQVQLSLCSGHFRRSTTLAYITGTRRRCLAFLTRPFRLCKAWIEHQAHLGPAFRTTKHSR